ncbi:hypothetical protein CHU98_g12159, partial [Xylaria longipes]
MYLDNSIPFAPGEAKNAVKGGRAESSNKAGTVAAGAAPPKLNQILTFNASKITHCRRSRRVLKVPKSPPARSTDRQTRGHESRESCDMMSSSSSETELLTEHFGYPPVSLIDDIINSVNVLAERALNSIEQGLLNASPATLGFKAPKSQSQSQSQQDDQLPPAERAKNEIESGTHQLETLLCASIDRNFDKFELYVLRNIFTVRPPELSNWIRLSHYDGLDFSARRRRGGGGGGGGDDAVEGQQQQQQSALVQRDGDAPTIESITALRRRLRESMRLNALLTAERARNEVLLEDLRRLVGDPSASAPRVKAEE